jgi:hypothetical protein
MPGEDSCPFQPKASDWGWFEGRVVALDYSTPASERRPLPKVLLGNTGGTLRPDLRQFKAYAVVSIAQTIEIPLVDRNGSDRGLALA